MAAPGQVSLRWGLSGQEIPVAVQAGSTAGCVCKLLQAHEGLTTGAVVKLLPVGSHTPLHDCETLQAGEIRAVVQQGPTLFLVKRTDTELLTAKELQADMGVQWHGGTSWNHASRKHRSLLGNGDGGLIRKLGEPLTEAVQCKARELQEAVDGLRLPAGSVSCKLHSFVLHQGAEADLRSALLQAFGFLEEYGDDAVLWERHWQGSFLGEEFTRATEIVSGFGRTYEFNFNADVECCPVLYLAQDAEELVVLGLVGCRSCAPSFFAPGLHL